MDVPQARVAVLDGRPMLPVSLGSTEASRSRRFGASWRGSSAAATRSRW